MTIIDFSGGFLYNHKREEDGKNTRYGEKARDVKVKRKTELSVMNVFFCMLVIFIHVSSAPVTGLTRPSWQFAAVFTPWKLASFVVYGFFFLGGIRFALHPPEDGAGGMMKYYLKRLLRIVIPYVLWVAAYVLWSMIFAGEKVTFSLYFDRLIHGTAAAHFYYVLTAIQFYLLAPLWKRLKKESAAVVLPLALAVTLLFGHNLPEIAARLGCKGEILNDRIFTTYLFYWVAGIYAGMWYDRFCEFLRRRVVWVSLFFIAAAVPEVWCNYLGQAYEKWFSASFASSLHLLYICAAILFFMTMALFVDRLRFFRTCFFRTLDRCTFSVYLSHLMIMGTVNYLIGKFYPSATILKAYLIRTAATYAVTIAVCMILCAAVQRLKEGKKGRTGSGT